MLTTMFCFGERLGSPHTPRCLGTTCTHVKCMCETDIHGALSYVEHTWTCSLTDRPSQAGPTFSHFTEREKMPRNENHCRFTLNYFLQNYSAAFSASGGHRVHKHIIHTVAGACVAREYFDKTNVHDFIFFVVSTHTHWSQNELAVFISQPVGSSLNYISIQHLGGIKWYESERETEFAERRNQAK